MTPEVQKILNETVREQREEFFKIKRNNLELELINYIRNEKFSIKELKSIKELIIDMFQP